MVDLAPTNTELQNKAASVKRNPAPKNCLVTGGTGFVGQRLVEMLVERGAERVVSLDIVPPTKGWDHPNIEYITCDIADQEAVSEACKGMDCVWHNAAAVGPFHPDELYMKVNYHGTLNVLEACRLHGVPKLVMSSSPSTRFNGEDLDGLSEEQLPSIPMKAYLQNYAASKAAGEKAVTDACCDELMTIAVAPHQVYGPRDNLFMPNMLEAAGAGLLRVFASYRTGYGYNRVCFTHVDNYCHGLIISADALYQGSPALGKFYIVTDGDSHPFPEGYAHLWTSLEEAVVELGFPSLWDKFKLPDFLLLPIAHACDMVSWCMGTKLKLNPFNVKVLTMHRWFRIDNAVRDLEFEPIIEFKSGWADTIDWFKTNWLPKFKAEQAAGGSNVGLFGNIASQSQRKIDIQAGKKQH